MISPVATRRGDGCVVSKPWVKKPTATIATSLRDEMRTRRGRIASFPNGVARSITRLLVAAHLLGSRENRVNRNRKICW
jgi:hypothetical protein